jgi:hypothetical protein
LGPSTAEAAVAGRGLAGVVGLAKGLEVVVAMSAALGERDDVVYLFGRGRTALVQAVLAERMLGEPLGPPPLPSSSVPAARRTRSIDGRGRCGGPAIETVDGRLRRHGRFPVGNLSAAAAGVVTGSGRFPGESAERGEAAEVLLVTALPRLPGAAADLGEGLIQFEPAAEDVLLARGEDGDRVAQVADVVPVRERLEVGEGD